MDLNNLKTQTVRMTPEDITRAREDPTNEVYEYEDKPLAPWQRIDASVAGKMAGEIRTAYLQYREREPTLTDTEIRGILGARDRKWGSFARDSHTTMWLALTDRTSSEDKIQTMAYLARVRVQVDNGILSEATAQTHVQEYLLEKCKKGT